MRKTPCPRCVAALASILPIALVLTGTPVDAGVLDRAKSVSGYPKGFLDEGMDLIGYGMSDDADTYERRADEFFRRQEHEGRKTFTDVVTDALADGKGKVSDGWKNLKGKVGNTLLGKAADAVKEKVWDAFAPDARPGGRHPPGGNGANALSARDSSTLRRHGSAAEGEADGSHTPPAPMEADGDAPEESGPNAVEPDGQGGAPDPLIALDIDDEEQDWYHTETDLLDGTPLPKVADRAGTDGGAGVLLNAGPGAYGGTGDTATGSAGDCEDAWGSCSDEYWNEELQAGARRIDPWADYTKASDDADATAQATPRGSDAGVGASDSESSAASGQANPWGETEVAAQNLPAHIENEEDEADDEHESYNAALAATLGDTPRQEPAEDGYAAALAALERGEAEQTRRLADSSFDSGSSPSYGSGSSAAPRSQNCEVPTPTCLEVTNRIEARSSSLLARIDAGGLSGSESADLFADFYKTVAAHLPACYASETRPHCKEAIQRTIEEMQRAYEEQREIARQWRGE